ncbi:hypothetical protein NS365_15620 [Aureimonas ureilytica]|uniref:DUF2809 domain-containing protein n=1 Tax=Aureimonas ureilytica TaxID=401562 RepID=A0A175RMW3_9HYPH|nr:DUF2809 domain-containing protein [Aureimonas ureilytica]KTR04304.1 hypothetical protein NS365_15620 [Aureimonas ureilytica]
MASAPRRRLALLGAAALVILAGLSLRAGGYRLGLSFFAVKYGGSLLWGSMVYFLIAAFLPRRGRVAGLALALAVAVEFSRLVHTPAFDAFRLTTAGALLLGRVFSLWNILAYAIGIGLAALLDRALLPGQEESRQSAITSQG